MELSRHIAQEYSQAAEGKRQQTHPRPPLTQNAHPNATVAAYYAHYENIKRHLHMEDMSRVDAMIALRLRATGHSPEAVLAAVFQCAPGVRQDNGKKESRNWHQYAERTTAYAFGTAGDVTLTKNERYLEHWRKIEGAGGVKRVKEMQEEQRMRIR